MTRRAVMIVPHLAIAIVCMSIASLGAHDRKAAGPLTVVLGWATEPTYSGAMNAVIVSLSDRGGPLTKADGGLNVEVTFGTERTTLALEPVPNRPYEFLAAMVPTRAGTYRRSRDRRSPVTPPASSWWRWIRAMRQTRVSRVVAGDRHVLPVAES